jgi:hypothetical protein
VCVSQREVCQWAGARIDRTVNASTLACDYSPIACTFSFDYELLYSIRSVAQIHPTVANNPNILNIQSVNVSNAGTPIDPLTVTDAEGTVKVLSGAKGECSLLHVHNN